MFTDRVLAMSLPADLRRCRPGDIDGFTLWCWTVAGLMAADMDEYLRRCTIQSISALWTTVRCNFG